MFKIAENLFQFMLLLNVLFKPKPFFKKMAEMTLFLSVILL